MWRTHLSNISETDASTAQVNQTVLLLGSPWLAARLSLGRRGIDRIGTRFGLGFGNSLSLALASDLLFRRRNVVPGHLAGIDAVAGGYVARGHSLGMIDNPVALSVWGDMGVDEVPSDQLVPTLDGYLFHHTGLGVVSSWRA